LGKTVSELDMSWREFLHWQAYLQIENPEKGANERTAAIMAQITNMSGRSLPDKKMVTAEEFLGTAKTPQQSMQDQINFMKSLGDK
jgi:hypothetical protein